MNLHLRTLQLEISIGNSWVGTKSVPKVTFYIATFQRGNKIRGDKLVRTRHANHSSLRLTLSVIKTEKGDVKVNSDISDCETDNVLIQLS